MLGKRLLTIAILLPLFLAALFYLPNAWWAAVLAAVIVLGAWEWGALAGYPQTGRILFTVLVIASTAAVEAAAGSVDLYVYGSAVAFWLLVAPLWLARLWTTRHPAVMAIVGWLLLVPTWVALVRLQPGAGFLLAVLGIVWVADTAAYLVGRRWGKHKLAPRISPGKTWEGLFGAVAAVALYYLILWFIVSPDHPLVRGAAGAATFAAVTVLSVIGDLFESWMKRQAGLKDSGQLLPGHGGVLDRIDGWTATLPIVGLAAMLLG
jgi:phosphatidate cytidylyltransferase